MVLGRSGPQRFQIHKAYGGPERLPLAHTWFVFFFSLAMTRALGLVYLRVLSLGSFNQIDLPEYPSKEQLQERLLLAIHEASEGFGFG